MTRVMQPIQEKHLKIIPIRRDNMLKNYFISGLVFILPSLSFAFFCPTNFKQIDYGMTIEQVIKECGNPTSQVETSKANDNVPQEWSYYVPQTVTNTTYSQAQAGQAQGTLKTQVTFDSEGNAINISVNGIGVGSTTICGSMIQLGDKRDAIKSACGDPSFINKQQSNTSSLGTGEQKEIKVMTFHYQTNPPVTLIFENGVLKEKQ